MLWIGPSVIFRTMEYDIHQECTVKDLNTGQFSSVCSGLIFSTFFKNIFVTAKDCNQHWEGLQIPCVTKFTTFKIETCHFTLLHEQVYFSRFLFGSDMWKRLMCVVNVQLVWVLQVMKKDQQFPGSCKILWRRWLQHFDVVNAVMEPWMS